MKDTTKAGVLDLVRRMINRGNENKAVGWRVESNVSHNSPIGAADCEPIVGQIGTGTTAQGRIGDKLKPKSLRVKGTISFTPDTCTTSQNLYVRVIIAAQKNIKVGSNVLGGSVDAAHLLRPAFAGAAEQAFDGTTQALDYPVNRELFKVYMDKVIKLTASVVTGGGVEQMPLYSGRYSYSFKSMPTNLSFDAGNGDWVNNFAPFICLGYAFSDGTTDSVITTRLKSNIYSILEFEDA